MKKITKAVIAVAGSGTRLLPATKAMPKEMLPIVDKPIIQLVVEELVEAGIEDIILVTKWDKKPLEDHFDHNWALANELKTSGKEDIWEEIKNISEMANFIYIRQKGPKGNGTPVLSAANLVKDEPFIFVWGDDLVKSEKSFSKQLVEDYAKHGQMIIGVQEVAPEDVVRYGIVRIKEGTKEMEDIVEKPAMDQAPSRLAVFGRMIFNPDFVETLQKTALGKDSELWVTDAIKNYVKNGGKFMVKEVEGGQWLTTGDPLNYLRAILTYAFDRQDISADLKEYIKKLI